MSSPASGWCPPLCDSRTGAAHLRRGAPCQDASGVWSFVDAGRQSVQLLVVSDGHGGSRYDRSEVGSHLACDVALQAARELFRAHSAVGTSPEEWRRWLAQDLPRRIVSRWRQQVLAHAEAHPRSDGAAPSTIPYGATLGLLLLTPRWWGCTGLGDWDLVRLDGAGQGQLLSEEPDTPGGGEATFSLCMEGAEKYFSPRSSLCPIPEGSEAFSLLLSTDGIRKSCGTDADFLTLAHYLCGLPAVDQGRKASELAGALDHISSQGSGDDVSVAIGRWGPLRESERRQGRRRAGQPLIVQPPRVAGPASIPPGGPQAMPPSAGEPSPPSNGLIATANDPASRPLVPFPIDTGPRRALGSAPWLLVAVAAGVLAGAALGLAFALHQGPFARRQPGPEPPPLTEDQLDVVQSEATRLCTAKPPPADRTADGPTALHRPDDAREGGIAPGERGRILGALTPYKSTFRRLSDGSPTPEQILSDPQRDPLGSLIAWSAREPGLGPLPHRPQEPPPRPDAVAGLLRWVSARLGREVPSGRRQSVDSCPELEQALRQQWQALSPKFRPTPPPNPTGGLPMPPSDGSGDGGSGSESPSR